MVDPFPHAEPAGIEATPPDPRPPWRARDLLFTLFGGLGLALVLVFLAAFAIGFATRDAGFSYSASMAGAMGILIYVGLAIAAWYFALRRRGATLADAGFRRMPGSTLLKMVPVTIGLLILNLIVIGISSAIFGDVPTARDQVVGDATSISLEEFVWLFALGAIAAPIVEEFLFRGLLYPLMRVRFKVVGAILLSSLLFAAVHFIPPLIPALLMMGVVLAYLAERYDSLYPAITVHALNNAFALIALYATIGR
jgi:uncharacterized protein